MVVRSLEMFWPVLSCLWKSDENEWLDVFWWNYQVTVNFPLILIFLGFTENHKPCLGVLIFKQTWGIRTLQFYCDLFGLCLSCPLLFFQRTCPFQSHGIVHCPSPGGKVQVFMGFYQPCTVFSWTSDNSLRFCFHVGALHSHRSPLWNGLGWRGTLRSSSSPAWLQTDHFQVKTVMF